jgi:hypothetical protein
VSHYTARCKHRPEAASGVAPSSMVGMGCLRCLKAPATARSSRLHMFPFAALPREREHRAIGGGDVVGCFPLGVAFHSKYPDAGMTHRPRLKATGMLATVSARRFEASPGSAWS